MSSNRLYKWYDTKRDKQTTNFNGPYAIACFSAWFILQRIVRTRNISLKCTVEQSCKLKPMYSDFYTSYTLITKWKVLFDTISSVITYN